MSKWKVIDRERRGVDESHNKPRHLHLDDGMRCSSSTYRGKAGPLRDPRTKKEEELPKCKFCEKRDKNKKKKQQQG
jgi:hypothetical protein